MTLEEEFRSGREIICDLLWFAEMDLKDLAHPERYDAVKKEAREYVVRAAQFHQAWDSLNELARTELDQSYRVNYDTGI